MEVLGSVHIFLTPNQRSWMNAIKNAAAKKPKKKVKRPEVMKRSLILLKQVPRLGSHALYNEHRSVENKILANTHLFDNFPSIQNHYQAVVFDMVESRKFEMFIILVITVNMILMMVQHYDQPPQVTLLIDILLFKYCEIRFSLASHLSNISLQTWDGFREYTSH